MNILDSIFEKWNKDNDVEHLISSGFLTDKNAIQKVLDNLNGAEKEKALSTLNNIQSALQVYISEMEQNMVEIKNQIDTTHKSEKACISYGSSINIQNNKKENKED